MPADADIEISYFMSTATAPPGVNSGTFRFGPDRLLEANTTASITLGVLARCQ